MGKDSRPPPPNYGPIAKASERAARDSYRLSQQQMRWAQRQSTADRKVSNMAIADARKIQAQSQQDAARDRAIYERTYQPLEKELIADSRKFSSEGYQEQQAGKASAGVAQEFDAARNAAMDRLESYGIDPSQTRAGALDVSIRTQEAAARASAANQMREQTAAQGREMRAQAINIGRGYPGQVQAGYSTALQGGNAAVNAGLATTSTGSSTMGTPTQWSQLGQGSLTGWGNMMNMGYNNALDAYKAEQAASSGWGQVAGMALGMGTRYATGGTFAEGGPVEDYDQGYDGGMPQQALPIGGPGHAGMPVPAAASPSGGAELDDVPARLQVGEFVIPKDVMSWVGQKSMQQLIEKSRKDADEAGAQPDVRALPVERPALSTG